MTLPEAVEVSEMSGATAETAGSAGLVPAPEVGEQNKFLRGDGTWADVEGDGNTVTNVTSANGSVSVIEIKDSENDTITYDLSTAEYAIQKDGYVEGSKERTYHLTKDGEAFGVAITVPVAYDDTEALDRISELEEKVSYKADKSDVDASFANVYTKSEINAELVKKADATNVYTKAETDIELAKKADATNVYTKAETDTKIGEAIAAADHLKRVIIDAPEGEEEIEDVINEWLINNSINASAADQYIYMVPSGLTADDNKYYEYIIIIDGENRYAEQVGNWEVDLSDYVTNKNLNDTLANYVTSTDLNTTLGSYALKTDIPTDYVSDEEIKAYSTKEEADALYAAKDATEQAINNRYTKEEVDDLIGVPGTPEVGKPEDENYQPAVAGTGVYQHVYSKNEITDLIADITGGESAADVKAELTAYKTSNDAEISIIKAKVGTIAEGAEVNAIHSVDSNIFSVVTDADNSIDRQLQLVKVPVGKLEGLTNEFELDIENNVLGIAKVNVSKLEGLTDWITANRETIPGLYPVEAKNLLDSLNALVNDETNGLNKKVDEHNSRITSLEDAMTWKNL
jgi:hypothetical protein